MWTKAPNPKAELPATSDFPHLASLPVRETGETIAAVCPEFGIASGTRQRQTVRPWRSNREIYCCPHLDHRSSADSLFVGVHVTTPSSRERDEHRCKTFGDNDRTAHSDGHRGNHTGSACPCSDCRTDQSSGDNSTNHHPQEPTATAALIATAAPIPPSLPESQTEPLLLSTTTPTIVLRVTVSAVPSALPDYDRNDWKHWSDADRDCQDARNEVLIAESQTSVTYRTDKKCKVATGEWLALYNNTVVTDPGKLDIDHMVPLGNAHGSGAWLWSANRREQYANHLDDPQHLIAVTASANRSKGARGPEDWKP